MARSRTTKSIAERIDLGYWRRAHPLRSWRFRLSLLAVSLAAVAIVANLPEKRRIFWSAGDLTPAHAFTQDKCGACHASGRSGKVSDQACTSCHAGTVHAENQTTTPPCASCHREHEGRLLVAVADAHCTSCHAALASSADKPVAVNRTVTVFPDGHPEFAAVAVARDPGKLRLNHGVHMWNGLRGPKGPEPLSCTSCHQPDTAAARMLPVRYEKHCSRCHTLELEVEKGKPPLLLPHGSQENLATALSTYLKGRSVDGVPARLTEATKVASKALCERCHGEAGGRAPGIPNVWMPRADFAHRPHRSLECVACHAAAASSSSTQDVLLPSKAVCVRCHQASNATLSACETCHRYHPREVAPLTPATWPLPGP